MKIEATETPRPLLRGFTKNDALWAYSISDSPKMNHYLPDEAVEEIDDEYLKMPEGLGKDDECRYLIPILKDSLQHVGTCSFMISEGGKAMQRNCPGLIDYAGNQGTEKVTIFVEQDNISSSSVVQKCGGTIVGESTCKSAEPILS